MSVIKDCSLSHITQYFFQIMSKESPSCRLPACSSTEAATKPKMEAPKSLKLDATTTQKSSPTKTPVHRQLFSDVSKRTFSSPVLQRKSAGVERHRGSINSQISDVWSTEAGTNICHPASVGAASSCTSDEVARFAPESPVRRLRRDPKTSSPIKRSTVMPVIANDETTKMTKQKYNQLLANVETQVGGKLETITLHDMLF